jgi:oligosaccharide repeat unit polymerase
MNNTIEIVWLYANIALWGGVIVYYWRKQKSFGANILILLTYLGYSIVSLILYKMTYPEYKGITLFPFVFLFSMVLIALRPVTKFSSSRIDNIIQPNNKIFTAFLAFFAICSLISLLRALPQMRTGIFMILTDAAAGQDIYDESMSGATQIGNGTSLMNLPVIFSNVFADVGALMTFYYLTRPKIKKSYAILLVITLLSPFLQAISESQRGPAIDRLYTIAITYMLFRPFYSDRIKKIARIGAIVIASFLFVTMAAITLSRFGQQSEERATESVYSYIGMENLNFNLYAFDNNGLRYGDRTAPMFKRMIGFDNVPKNFSERRAKYPHLRIDDYLFIGFVGDFCLDYGPFVAFLLFVVFSTLFLHKTLVYKRSISFHKLILIQFAACVCMCGGMKLFSFADLGNLKIIAMILSYWLFKYAPKNGRKIGSTNENVLELKETK